MTSSSFDKIINRAISDFYLKDYKVEFKEKIDEELVKKYEENTKRIERMAIEIAEQEITEAKIKTIKIKGKHKTCPYKKIIKKKM